MTLRSLFGKAPISFGVVVLVCCSSIDAFTTCAVSARTTLLLSAPQTRPSKVGPLWYRQLDEKDDEMDPVMMKVVSRAPPGYDVKKALQEQNQMSEKKQPANAMNRLLIRALTINQYLILGLASMISAVILYFTQGPAAFDNLNSILQWSGGSTGIFDFNLTAERLLWGIGAALPLLAFNAAIENSDNRAFVNINFSTITMCMTLFGRRSAPLDDFLPDKYKTASDGASKFPTTRGMDVAVQSFILSTVTGFCEEIVFRREVPAMLALLLGSNGDLIFLYLGQAILFGLGHAQPGSKLAENSILVGLQTVNGLGFGLLYILTGGDLVPCIIAHATYDFVVFFKTWKDANDQIEYAETMYSKPLPKDVDQEVQRLLRASPKIEPRVYNLVKRLFYTFDFDKNETLSLSEVRKGISYMAIEKAGIPPPQSEIDRLFASTVQSRELGSAKSGSSSRLTFPDFLRLLSLMNTEQVNSKSASPG
jgi:Type II CAAX prenyl endopeptidase Rce1-like